MAQPPSSTTSATSPSAMPTQPSSMDTAADGATVVFEKTLKHDPKFLGLVHKDLKQLNMMLTKAESGGQNLKGLANLIREVIEIKSKEAVQAATQPPTPQRRPLPPLMTVPLPPMETFPFPKTPMSVPSTTATVSTSTSIDSSTPTTAATVSPLTPMHDAAPSSEPATQMLHRGRFGTSQPETASTSTALPFFPIHTPPQPNPSPFSLLKENYTHEELEAHAQSFSLLPIDTLRIKISEAQASQKLQTVVILKNAIRIKCKRDHLPSPFA